MARPSKKKAVAKPAVAGRILEMRPVSEKKAGAHWPPILVLLPIAVAGIASAAMSYQRMSAALIYADRVGIQAASAQARIDDLQEKVTDLRTLQTLAAKVPDQAAAVAVSVDGSWQDYSSKNIAVRFPQGFTAVKATGDFPALTIKGGGGRLEIFRLADFGGERKIKAVDDQSVPKSALRVGLPGSVPYEVWAYYAAGDAAAKAQLEAIASTVKALR